MIYIIIKE